VEREPPGHKVVFRLLSDGCLSQLPGVSELKACDRPLVNFPFWWVAVIMSYLSRDKKIDHVIMTNVQ